MKRTLAIFILLTIAAVALFADSFEYIWSWRANDPDVKYYRYSTDDDSRWRLAEDSTFRVHFFYDELESHTMFIQQSYDGVNWSESTSKTYTPIREYAGSYGKYTPNRYTVGVAICPYESYTSKDSNQGLPDYYSLYAGNAEANFTRYFFKGFGVGVSGTASILLKDTSSAPSMTYGLYVLPTARIIASKGFDLSLKVGAGVHLEGLDDQMLSTPAAYAGINASIRLTDRVSVSIAPSVTYSYAGLLEPGNEYTVVGIRAFAIGIEGQY